MPRPPKRTGLWTCRLGRVYLPLMRPQVPVTCNGCANVYGTEAVYIEDEDDEKTFDRVQVDMPCPRCGSSGSIRPGVNRLNPLGGLARRASGLPDDN